MARKLPPPRDQKLSNEISEAANKDTLSKRRRVTLRIAEMMASGEWGALDAEDKDAAKSLLCEEFGYSPHSIRLFAEGASIAVDLVTHDRERIVMLNKLRLEAIAGDSAEKTADQLTAIGLQLRAAGALGTGRSDEDLSQLDDDRLRERMVRDIARPDKFMRSVLREAFAQPGKHLRELLEEWLKNTAVEAE